MKLSIQHHLLVLDLQSFEEVYGRALLVEAISKKFSSIKIEKRKKEINARRK